MGLSLLGHNDRAETALLHSFTFAVSPLCNNVWVLKECLRERWSWGLSECCSQHCLATAVSVSEVMWPSSFSFCLVVQFLHKTRAWIWQKDAAGPGLLWKCWSYPGEEVALLSEKNVLLTVSLTFSLFHPPCFLFSSPSPVIFLSENMIMNWFLLISTSLNSLWNFSSFRLVRFLHNGPQRWKWLENQLTLEFYNFWDLRE